MKSDEALIHYVVEQIEKLEDYLKNETETSFVLNAMLYDACVLKIMVVGEYSSKLSRGFKAKYPEIEWRLIKAARNYYAHDYGDLTPERVWQTATTEIPLLKQQMEQILKDYNATNQ